MNATSLVTYLGAAAKTLLVIILYLLANPHALDGLMPPETERLVISWLALTAGIIGAVKDYFTQGTPPTTKP